MALGLSTFAASAQALLAPSPNFQGEIVPQYMATAGTSNRLPVVYKARVSGLTPNATYRFISRGATQRDLGKAQDGAGNPLFLNPGGSTLYTTQPRLRAGVSGTFTTDAQGAFSGWFSFVPTGNSRFGQDSLVYPSLSLNGGTNAATDTVALNRYALNMTIKAVALGTSANQGTGIWGNSQATAKNAVALYDNAAGQGRPLSTAVVENIAATIASQPTWYGNNVAGQNGAWGTMLPNDLASGVLNITQYAVDGSIVGNNTSANGSWGSANTVNPSGGNTTPIQIGAASAPLNSVTEIRRGHVQSLTAFHNAEQQQLVLAAGEATRLRICNLTGVTVAKTAIVRGQQAVVSTQGWMPGLYLVVDEQAGRMVRVIVR